METELKAAYAAVLGSDNALRRQAEDYLRSIEATPGFLVANLAIVSAPLSSPQDAAIRQSAAVLFKNVVKRLWAPVEEGDAAISPADKEAIKSHLVSLMCSTSPDIQRQLAEVVAVVAKHDFPSKWPALMPQLVEKLNTSDLRVILGVMLTANSIFKKFRYIYKTEELMEQLLYCLNAFQAPLTEVYKASGTAILTFANDKDSLVVVMETLRLMTRIFFSLNWQDLPEFFEDNIGLWMGEFAKYLTYFNPLLVNPSDEIEPGPIEKLQAAIIENLSLYVTKYEEEFAPHLPMFTQLIWKLLMEVSAFPKHDNLATQAIKFLTCVSSKKVNAPLFTDPVVRDIIEQIVVRNLTATDADEELFEDNAVDFIRRDIEGSDQDTRRRCATELVRSLMKFVAGPTSATCLGYISSMLSQYSASKDWKAKDAALHLLLAVTANSSSIAQGAGEINLSINIIEMLTLHVIPELQDPNINARPILKSDALKLLCIFRNHLEAPILISLMPHFIRHLYAKSIVVQTYAALVIEKVLTLKAKGAAPSITKDDIAPHLQALFQGLFSVIENASLPDNDYVMRCVMRVLIVMGPEVAPVSSLVLSKLIQILDRVSRNPVNPHFNHYLFECIAVLIRSCCGVLDASAAATACSHFESLLFPPFQAILSTDVAEFIPYVFQILAVLLSYRPTVGLSEPYKALIQPLLMPVLWERKGNVPALTDLIVSYIRKGMQDIEASGSVQPLLGVFQKLLSNKATEKLAFRILNALVACYPFNSLAPYAPTIWQLLMTKLQDQKNSGYPKLFFHAMAIFALHYGATATFDLLEKVSMGVVKNLILQVWAPLSASIASGDDQELKETLLGGTKLLCETPIAQDPEVFGHLLKALVQLANARAVHHVEVDFGDDVEERGFDTAYSKLAFCQLPEIEHDKAAQQAGLHFVNSLSSLCQRHPGRYVSIISSSLDTNEANFLASALKSAGLSIV